MIHYSVFMSKTQRTEKVDKHLKEKRNEIIWSLSIQQRYTDAHIGKIFNIKHRSTVKRIIDSKPRNWKSKWIKV